MKVEIRKIVIINLLVIAFVSAGVSSFISSKQNDITTQLQARIVEEQNKLITISAKNSNVYATEKTNGVVNECPSRFRHDNLLGNLRQLDAAELREVKDLHASCGMVSPISKAIQTQDLEASVTRYQQLVDLLAVLDPQEAEQYPVSPWITFVEHEKEVAVLLTEQSRLQLSIIQAMIDGNNAQVNEVATKAQNLNDTLSVKGVQLNAEREQLLSL